MYNAQFQEVGDTTMNTTKVQIKVLKTGNEVENKKVLRLLLTYNTA